MYRSKETYVRSVHHGIALLVLVWMLGIGYRLFMPPCSYAVVMDSYVSMATRAALHAACLELPRRGWLRADALRLILQHISASVREVTIDYRSPQRAVITIHHARPRALINHGLVLVDDNALISTTEYSLVALEQLPHMTVQNYEQHPEEQLLYLSFLSSIPADILSSYFVVWFDMTRILLVSRSEMRIEFSAWHTTQFSDDMVRAMQCIEQKIKTGSLTTRKRGNGKWLIDLRVPEYLIVAKELS